jgi:hypothetical protein
VNFELIANDLVDHDWYDRLVRTMIADVEAYLACWATFEDRVAEFED